VTEEGAIETTGDPDDDCDKDFGSDWDGG